MFDNNCGLRRCTQDDLWWDDIELTVDVFHHQSKHSLNDLLCQTRCNPAAYPELQSEDGGWFFNSSIAEQTNVWLAGYNAMCREMGVDLFNFFLDEMIIRRNREVVTKLKEQGKMPSYWTGLL